MVQIIYDGECPFCSQYVALVRLRDSIGEVDLIDARSGDPRVAELAAQGFDFDEGMALVYQDRVYFGPDCIHQLALLSTSSTLFNRINAWIFRSAAISRALYPVLRFGRNAVLWLLSREKINN